MLRQENKGNIGFPFLEKVSDSDLRIWKEFAESPLFAFLVTHFEKERRATAEKILKSKDYLENPLLLAEQQGRVWGHQEVLSVFFDKVKKEHERRTSRHANAGSGSTR